MLPACEGDTTPGEIETECDGAAEDAAAAVRGALAAATDDGEAAAAEAAAAEEAAVPAAAAAAFGGLPEGGNRTAAGPAGTVLVSALTVGY